MTYEDVLGNMFNTTSQLGRRLESATDNAALLCIETRGQLDEGFYGTDCCMGIDE